MHSLVVVTPNLADFAATGVPLLNPWQQGEGRPAQMAATDRGFQKAPFAECTRLVQQPGIQNPHRLETLAEALLDRPRTLWRCWPHGCDVWVHGWLPCARFTYWFLGSS